MSLKCIHITISIVGKIKLQKIYSIFIILIKTILEDTGFQVVTKVTIHIGFRGDDTALSVSGYHIGLPNCTVS